MTLLDNNMIQKAFNPSACTGLMHTGVTPEAQYQLPEGNCTIILPLICSHSPQDFADQELSSRQASGCDSKTPEERGSHTSLSSLFL